MIMARHARRLALSSKTLKEQQKEAERVHKRVVWSFS
jgi:hypothetical protein